MWQWRRNSLPRITRINLSSTPTILFYITYFSWIFRMGSIFFLYLFLFFYILFSSLFFLPFLPVPSFIPDRIWVFELNLFVFSSLSSPLFGDSKAFCFETTFNRIFFHFWIIIMSKWNGHLVNEESGMPWHMPCLPHCLPACHTCTCTAICPSPLPFLRNRIHANQETQHNIMAFHAWHSIWGTFWEFYTLETSC